MQPEKKDLKNILLNLERAEIHYILLRGGDFFSTNEKQGELDILVPSKKLKLVKKIFKKISHSREFKNNIDLTHPFLIRVKKEDYLLDFDFQIKGIAYCGSPVLKEKFLFQNTKKKEGLIYLNTEGELLMLLIHSFVFKKKFEYFEKYKERFLELYEKAEKEKIQRELEKIFGKKYSTKIINCIKKRNLEKLFNLRKKLIRIHLTKNPLEIFPVFISKIMRLRNYLGLSKFFYFINPFKWAPLISFIGSDGSGKSTLCKTTEKYLDEFKIPNKKIPLGAFSRFKNPLNKKKKSNYSERVISASKKKKGFEILARIILQIPNQMRVLYYRKKGIYIVSDRYPYDIVNFYGARGLLKWLTKAVSQNPTKCFYVKVSPEILKKRNNDLNLEAIKGVISRIEDNKKYFSLIEIENENFSKSGIKLKKHLSKVIKNV